VSTGRAAAGDNGAGEIYFVQAGKVSRTIKNRTTRPAPPSMNGVTQAVVNVPRPPISQNY